jgi:Tol biopolymer transport system component
MRADGNRQRRLTHDRADDGNPVWAPDGSRIAFNTDRDGNIEISSVRPDGTGMTRLTYGRAFDGDPVWSPDGDRIAFTSERNGTGLFVMNADGGDLTELKPVVGEGDPSWSPDGRFIAFTKYEPGIHQGTVSLLALASGRVTPVTASLGDACCPAWRPAYVRAEPGP